MKGAPTPPEQEAGEPWRVTDEDIAACADRFGLKDRKGPVGDALIEFRDRLCARLSSEREPDGWVDPESLEDFEGDGSVAVFYRKGEHDLPVYIGHPPEKP